MYRYSGEQRTNGYIYIYTHTRVHTLIRYTHRMEFSFTFSPDGRYVASGSADGYIFIWDTTNAKIDTILKKGHKYISELDSSLCSLKCIQLYSFEDALIFIVIQDNRDRSCVASSWPPNRFLRSKRTNCFVGMN